MATRPLTACPRCQREFEAGRGVGPGGLYDCWGCAKAESQRLARQAGAPDAPARATFTDREGKAQPSATGACEWCGASLVNKPSWSKYCCRDHAVTACAFKARVRARNGAIEPRPHRSQREWTDAERAGIAEIILDRPPPPSLPGAACAGHPIGPDAWFQPTTSPLGQAAVRACLSCPQLSACRDWGVERAQGEKGILGGLSMFERARLKRQRQAADGQVA